jgi:hypothetical protein
MTDRSALALDLDELLHPAQAFDHPSEVVNDPDLTWNEKRAILASWASDACAVEAAPELYEAGAGRYVRFGDIIDALRTLDRQRPVLDDYISPPTRETSQTRSIWWWPRLGPPLKIRHED